LHEFYYLPHEEALSRVLKGSNFLEYEPWFSALSLSLSLDIIIDYDGHIREAIISYVTHMNQELIHPTQPFSKKTRGLVDPAFLSGVNSGQHPARQMLKGNF